MTLTAQGKVKLHTTAYPLDAVNDAMADLEGGRLQGRASWWRWHDVRPGHRLAGRAAVRPAARRDRDRAHV